MFSSKKRTCSEQVQHDHEEAQQDLLRAEKELEYWRAMVDMLRYRAERLAAYKDKP